MNGLDEPMAGTLVTLVGEQRMPVLLPIRALHPNQALFVCSDHTREAAQRVAALVPETTVEMLLLQDAYALEAIREALAVRLAGHEPFLLNLTGGTKPMTLAAFAVATAHDAPFVYLSTEGPHRSLRSRLDRYTLHGGVPVLAESLALPSLITLNDYLRAHYAGYSVEGPSDTAGGPLEEAVAAALTGWADEVLVGVRPQGLNEQVEIDVLVRAGNQVAVMEVKTAGLSGKDAVDQLTTAAAREFSGTYASRFVVVAQPIDARYKALARALNVRVIELPGAAGRGRLEKQHVIRLRQALHEVLPLPDIAARR